jgi:hypothetical protein
MKIRIWVATLFACISITRAIQAQSLAEVARKETERRKLLELQGISGRVIENHDPATPASRGDLSVFGASRGAASSSQSGSARARDSPQRYRSTLQKLDGAIRETGERVESLRRQAVAAWWAPRTRLSRRGRNGASEERLRSQIQDLESRLKRLKEDRFQVYDSGRRAGFLPGELDGKGIIP